MVRTRKASRSAHSPCDSTDGIEKEGTLSEPGQIPEESNRSTHSFVSSQSTEKLIQSKKTSEESIAAPRY